MNKQIDELIQRIDKDVKEIDRMEPLPDNSTFWSRLISRIKYELGLFDL